MLREFLADVRWGALDVLLVDLPPGTDRLDALVELLPRPPGVVVVTIPSEASFRSVRRAVEAAREAGLPIHGVIENMAGYRCAGCAAEGPSSRATRASAWRGRRGRRFWRASPSIPACRPRWTRAASTPRPTPSPGPPEALLSRLEGP